MERIGPAGIFRKKWFTLEIFLPVRPKLPFHFQKFRFHSHFAEKQNFGQKVKGMLKPS